MSSPPAPIRLVFCITDLDPGGAERALVQLVTRLDRARWEPMVVCLSESGLLVQELEQSDIPVICLGARRVWDPRIPFRLYRCLRRLRPALLQTYLYHANLLGRICGRLAGISCIVSGIRVAEKRSRFRLWLDRMTNGLVDRHVCVSRGVATFSQSKGKLPPQKLVVIPNGVDADRFYSAAPADLSAFGIPPDGKTAIAVGRLDPQKDPFLLLEAVRHVIPAHPELHLLLVGDGILRERIRAWVQSHQLADHIHFAGWQPDTAPLLKASDIFLLPSRWEGMPNALMEAMAAGLPVIATDIEGSSELVRNHENGILIPPQEPGELAAKLTLLLSDNQQAHALGESAHLFISKRFTWIKTVEAYEALYRMLLGN